jgi:hypothetical protein
VYVGVGECFNLHTRRALATRFATLAVGAVEILNIGQSNLQCAPTTLSHNELGVAHPACVDIPTQGVDECFVSNNLAKFHLFESLCANVNNKDTRITRKALKKHSFFAPRVFGEVVYWGD